MISLGKNRNQAWHRGRDDHEPLPIGHYIMLALILSGAFFLRYWFNFIDTGHINAYGSCDASEYLRNAQALLNMPSLPINFWQDSFQVLNGSATPATVQHIQASLASLKGLGISGPVFPAFLALSFAASFSSFSLANWQVPLFAQSIISALTCVFIALTGYHSFGKKTGYVAGAIAAFYPAFVINSGRLYSETFATFLLTVILYITSRNFSHISGSPGDSFRSNLISGFAAACLQFTRSLMVVLSAVLLPIILLQGGSTGKGILGGALKGLSGLLAFGLGFALIATPWLAWQKLEFGSMSLIVDRVGHYNFFIGNNVDTGGWLSFPYPDGRGIEEKSLSMLAKESFEKSPGRWLRLMQSKPLRLFKFPWNDFRAKLDAIEFQTQVLIHQVLLLLAGIGVSLSFLLNQLNQRKLGADDIYEHVGPSRLQARPSNAAKTFILFVFLLQCAYMFFITVPRYNLCAMPEVILFAAGGITSILTLVRLRHGVLPALALITATVLLFVCLHLALIPEVVAIFGGESATAGLIIQCLLRLLLLVAFGAALWLATGTLSTHELGDEGRRVIRATFPRAAVLIMVLLLVPILVLPSVADGRIFEWSCLLEHAKPSLSQTLLIPADFAKQTAGRQLYLLVDAGGLAGLAASRMTLNGHKLDAPLIPSISLCDDFTRYQDVTDTTYMREGEWVFDCLTQPAGMHNSDLRQWFVIPVVGLTVKPGAMLNVTISNADVSSDASTPHATVYGTYATGSKSGLSVPSIAICSWEKAFYGVENDKGLSDPRYDIKIQSLAAQPSNKDLSQAPGVQSGRFNIHLLAGPAIPAYNSTVATVERTVPRPACYIQLDNEIITSVLLPDNKPDLVLTPGKLPAFADNDLWIVRMRGKARREIGTARLNVGVKAYTADINKQGKSVAYVSPWGSEISLEEHNWQYFDVSVPLAPAELRAPLTKLALDVSVTNATNGADSVAAAAATELKNITVQIIRLPNNPLHTGYVIY